MLWGGGCGVRGDTRRRIAGAELTSDVVTEDPAGDDVAAGGEQSLQVRLQGTQSAKE